jgi:BirA family transcriptional regulator, biotin operon repressor / biotin---[acetyl-CoA-carboxylase] ligase
MNSDTPIEEIANQVLKECESTMELAKSLGKSGLKHGTWVSTLKQTGGRGRSGKTWVSLEGNLFLSVLIRLENKKNWSWLPIASGIAIAQALKKFDPSLEPKIKWPNDIWLGGKKVCGLLCEGQAGSQESFVVVGIGLNCSKAPQLETFPHATSLKEQLHKAVTANELRPLVLDSLLEISQWLEEEKLDAMRALYDENALFSPGSELQWEESSGEVSAGRVLGLGAHGELEVLDPSGKKRALFVQVPTLNASGGVSNLR